MKETNIIVAALFTVYQYDNKGPYFVYIVGNEPFNQGFDTMQGVAEYLYYLGYIGAKTADAVFQAA